MLPLDLSGEKFNLPMDWADLTLRQYFALEKLEKEDLPEPEYWPELFSILTGLSVEKWKHTNEFDLCEKMMPLIREWSNEPPVFAAKRLMPTVLTIAGKDYPISDKIELKDWVQKLVYEAQIKQYWSEELSDVTIDFIPVSLSIYLAENFTDIDNTFIDQILSEVKLYDGVEVSRFFLTNFMLSKQESMKRSIQDMTVKTAKPELNSLKSLLPKALFGTTAKKSG